MRVNSVNLENINYKDFTTVDDNDNEDYDADKTKDLKNQGEESKLDASNAKGESAAQSSDCATRTANCKVNKQQVVAISQNYSNTSKSGLAYVNSQLGICMGYQNTIATATAENESLVAEGVEMEAEIGTLTEEYNAEFDEMAESAVAKQGEDSSTSAYSLSLAGEQDAQNAAMAPNLLSSTNPQSRALGNINGNATEAETPDDSLLESKFTEYEALTGKVASNQEVITSASASLNKIKATAISKKSQIDALYQQAMVKQKSTAADAEASKGISTTTIVVGGAVVAVGVGCCVTASAMKAYPPTVAPSVPVDENGIATQTEGTATVGTGEAGTQVAETTISTTAEAGAGTEAAAQATSTGFKGFFANIGNSLTGVTSQAAAANTSIMAANGTAVMAAGNAAAAAGTEVASLATSVAAGAGSAAAATASAGAAAVAGASAAGAATMTTAGIAGITVGGGLVGLELLKSKKKS